MNFNMFGKHDIDALQMVIKIKKEIDDMILENIKQTSRKIIFNRYKKKHSSKFKRL